MSEEFSWSVDPTVHVDRVHIIESLQPDEQGWSCRTGARLFHELQDICARMPIEPHLHVIGTRADLLHLLEQVTAEARAGRFPLLHFETHGLDRAPGKTTTSTGLFLTSSECVAWRDLSPHFTAINEATGLQLIVFMSACYGLDMATLIQPLQQAPARALIGPMRTIDIGEIDRIVPAFYRALFHDRSSEAAMAAMNSAVEVGKFPFLLFTAERMFLTILQGYFNEMTNEPQIAARAENMIVQNILRGMPPTLAVSQREQLRTLFRDRRKVFDDTYRRFFFVDRHPEIADRFRMTYDLCFTEAPAATA
jgi:hypothetical protein